MSMLAWSLGPQGEIAGACQGAVLGGDNLSIAFWARARYGRKRVAELEEAYGSNVRRSDSASIRARRAEALA
jgi:hypothetical protein